MPQFEFQDSKMTLIEIVRFARLAARQWTIDEDAFSVDFGSPDTFVIRDSESEGEVVEWLASQNLNGAKLGFGPMKVRGRWLSLYFDDLKIRISCSDVEVKRFPIEVMKAWQKITGRRPTFSK